MSGIRRGPAYKFSMRVKYAEYVCPFRLQVFSLFNYTAPCSASSGFAPALIRNEPDALLQLGDHKSGRKTSQHLFCFLKPCSAAFNLR